MKSKLFDILAVFVVLLVALSAFLVPAPAAAGSSLQTGGQVTITQAPDPGILDGLLTQADQRRILIVMFFILADIVLGVTNAIVRREFDWDKLAAFLRTMIFPYIIILTLLEIGMHVLTPSTILLAWGANPPAWLQTFLDAAPLWTIYGVVMIALVKSVVSNLVSVLAAMGVNIQEAISSAKSSLSAKKK